MTILCHTFTKLKTHLFNNSQYHGIGMCLSTFDNKNNGNTLLLQIVIGESGSDHFQPQTNLPIITAIPKVQRQVCILLMRTAGFPLMTTTTFSGS